MFLYNYEEGIFQNFVYNDLISFDNETIKDLIAFDINNDNIMDIIIVTSKEDEELDTVYIYLGENNNNLKFIQYSKFKSNGILVLDINGDNKIAVLYFNDEKKIREVLFYDNKQL